MSDLVARLRDADTTRRIGESYADTHERRQRDRDQAAAEIERLNRELDDVWDALAIQREDNASFGDAFKRQAAEIERLRAKLALFACDCAVNERCAVPDNCRNFQARRMLEANND